MQRPTQMPEAAVNVADRKVVAGNITRETGKAASLGRSAVGFDTGPWQSAGFNLRDPSLTSRPSLIMLHGSPFCVEGSKKIDYRQWEVIFA